MKVTSYNELLKFFNNLGILTNDRVMIHGFFPSLGKLDNGYKTFFNALQETIGEKGNIIIPTFSYSYFRNEKYNVKETKSTIGEFSNYFLENFDCYRNMEPNFSMAGIGPNIKDILNRDTIYTFGRNGIYQKIEDNNVKFLLIGINWDQGLSYSMHIEHCAGVNYRYDKKFSGISIDYDSNEFEDKAIHFVKDLDLNPVRYRNRVGKILEEKGFATLVKFKYGNHRCVREKDYSEIALSKMKENPYYMLKEIDGKEVII